MAWVGMRAAHQRTDTALMGRAVRWPAPRRLRGGLLFAAALIVIAAAVVPAAPPAASAGLPRSAATSGPAAGALVVDQLLAAVPTVAPDSAVVLRGRVPTVAVPADGRLRGDGFAAMVLGVATGQATTTVRAGRGQQLWVLGLAATVSPPAAGGDNVGLQAVVSAGTTQAVLPLAPADAGGRIGPTWFVVSLPAGQADTVLSLSAAQYAQTFSLTHMTRQGITPTVSYRQATGGSTITVPAGAEAELPETFTGSLGYTPETFNLPVKLDSAVLSYFATDPPGPVAPTPATGWLKVTLQSNGLDGGDPSNFYSITQAANPATITLTVPGQPPVAAEAVAGGGGDNPGHEDGIYTPMHGDAAGAFPDTYYFTVPADLTTATLTVNPGVLNVLEDASGDRGTATPTPAGSAANLTITLPATTPYQAPPAASKTPAHLTTTDSGSTGGRAGGGAAGGAGTAVGVVAVLAGIGLLAAGGVVLARRRTAATPGPTGPEAASPAGQQPPGPDRLGAVDGPPSTSTGWGSVPPAPTAHPANQPPSLSLPPELPADSSTDLAEPTSPGPSPVAPPPADPATPAAPPGADRDADQHPLSSPAPEAGWAVRAWEPPGQASIAGPLVRMYGTLRLEGFDHPPEAANLVGLIGYLACHGRPVTVDKIRINLSRRSGSDLSVGTVHTYCSRARTQHLPNGAALTNTGAGYQLSGVATDVGHLHHATSTAADDPTEENLDRLAAAVALISGRPFDGDDYRWEPDLDPIAVARNAALTLARHSTPAHPDRALWACRQAQAATDPGSAASADQTVMAAALSAAAAIDQPGALTAEWDRCRRLLRAAGHDPDPRLVDHYHHLRPNPGGPTGPADP